VNGAQLHLLTVHIPVVGTLAALVLMVLGILRNSETLIRTAIGFVIVGTAFAAPAYFSGPHALEVTERFASLDEHLVEQHAIIAKAAFFASILLSAIGLKIWLDSFHGGTGKGTRVGLLCALLVIAWLMAWTGHLGGIIRHPEVRQPGWFFFPELPRSGSPSVAQDQPIELESTTTMTEAEFWAFIDALHQEAPYDWEEKEALLTARLKRLTTEQLRAYVSHWDAAMKEAYNWGLWAAAYVIHGGCSDDAFSDFRSTIITLGKEVFRRALEEPDSLLAAARASGGDLEHENFGYPIQTIWYQKTGESLPPSEFPVPLGSEPTGEAWGEEDLPRLLPALWQEYGE